MRPTGKAELGQHLNQDLQDSVLFFVYRDKPDEATAIALQIAAARELHTRG